MNEPRPRLCAYMFAKGERCNHLESHCRHPRIQALPVSDTNHDFVSPQKVAPEATGNMVTNVTMTIYEPEARREAIVRIAHQSEELGDYDKFIPAEREAAPEAKPEPRCAACGREKSSNRHDVRPDWYHAFVAEPASQPGETILCPQECLKFRMLGTCEHVAPEAKPERINRECGNCANTGYRNGKPCRECQAEPAQPSVASALKGIPIQNACLPTSGWNRYDTDDEHVLHVWSEGISYDVRVPKR